MLTTISCTKVTQGNFKREVKHLFLLVALEVANDSEWGGPSFEQPKPKSNQVGFLCDFRNINKQLNRKPYLMPKNMVCY